VPEPMLELDDLEVRYGPVRAVRGVNLTVGDGEVVGLVGPNGAGKSTTLLTVMGALRPAAGDIRLKGRSIARLAPERIVRAGVGLVPEGRHIFADLTVDENLRLGLVGRTRSDGLAEDLEWVQGLFPVVREFRARRAGDLSGGQQQQLAIARALVSGPDLILLDEPSLGLAPTVVDTVLDALDKIRQRGVSILLVEQRAQVCVGFADRTYVLNNGEIRMTLTPRDAGDTDRMVAAYFGS
jgi:branched-chain amino acid transport system ATP-binding protein